MNKILKTDNDSPTAVLDFLSCIKPLFEHEINLKSALKANKFIESSLCANHEIHGNDTREQFFIKELSNAASHASICDHFLIIISHVASVISFFQPIHNELCFESR